MKLTKKQIRMILNGDCFDGRTQCAEYARDLVQMGIYKDNSVGLLLTEKGLKVRTALESCWKLNILDIG